MRPFRLEYTSAVWDPYTVSCSDSIEKVQGHAARWAMQESYKPASTDQAWLPIVPCLKSWTGHCCSQEGWRPDSQGCTVRNGLPSIDSKHAPTLGNQKEKSLPEQLLFLSHNHHRTQYWQQTFFPHTIPEWHSLPECEAVATDPSLASFESRVQRYFYKATTVTPLLVMLMSLWVACNNYRK